MAQDGNYYEVIVETYKQPHKAGRIRVRPIAGQRFETYLNVECSRDERNKHPIGTKLRMKVKRTDREGGRDFLIADNKSNYEVVS